MTTYASLDIGESWQRLNDTIVALVDYIPDDKMDWSPREDLWNLRGILTHIAFVRHAWLGGVIRDGEPFDDKDVFSHIGDKDGLQKVLRDSWARVGKFLSDAGSLDRLYEDYDDAIDKQDPRTGHWVAFHLLEHDLHHRSDIFHYLALLGVDHPEIDTP